MPTANSLILASLVFLIPLPVSADVFGEGYSSISPNGPSEINYRAFTIYTLQEACEKSPVVAEFRVFPNPLVLKVGDRVHRSNVNPRTSELIVEAYGEGGEFLPAVPIVVSLQDLQGVLSTRSDWDYFEAVREGESELVVTGACPGPDGKPRESRTRVIVTWDNQGGV